MYVYVIYSVSVPFGQRLQFLVMFLRKNRGDWASCDVAQVYVIGGVGDKQYYNDVWILDITTCSWSQLEICGQQPQGRFSHTAVVNETDIAIYGG